MTEALRDSKGRRRVAITGIGHISCLGNSLEQAWQSVMARRSGIDRIQKFSVSDCAVQIAGEVRGLDFSQWMPQKLIREMDPFSCFAVIAATQALQQGGLVPADTASLTQIPLDLDVKS